MHRAGTAKLHRELGTAEWRLRLQVANSIRLSRQEKREAATPLAEKKTAAATGTTSFVPLTASDS
jgi:hypothetical protein